MNVKFAATGAAVLGLVLAGYAFREPLSNTVGGWLGATPPAAEAGNRAEEGSGGGRKGRRRGGGAVTVSVATVEPRAAPLQLHAIGTAQPLATVAVKARVDGQLVEAFFAEGERVTKGQKLFRIDPRPFEVSLRQAQANLARDRALFDKTRTDLARYGELVAQGYASRQKFEEVKAANAAAGAVLAADQAAIDQARLQLEYTTITAPIDGRTGNLLVSVGNLIKANDSNPLVTLTQLKPIYVSFSVAEQNLPVLRELMARKAVEVEARLTGDTGKPHTGTLSFINNMVDAGTGTIQLKATFPNDDEALTPGAFVNVALTLPERPEAIVVPTSAMQVGQKGSFVYVATDNNTAEMRPVTVADTYFDYTVVAAGLKIGEKVVTDGQLQLTPGARIRPRGNEAGTSSDAARPASADADTGEPKKKKRKKRKREGDGT